MKVELTEAMHSLIAELSSKITYDAKAEELLWYKLRNELPPEMRQDDLQSSSQEQSQRIS